MTKKSLCTIKAHFGMLPHVHLSKVIIWFDDRLQQVRIIKNQRGEIRFLNYRDDDGFYYVKKYRKNWADIVYC